eukprot:TRINITY_DN6673_c0_g1_i4.p1 TRINITY_DN6673_c0_g1~~TRINITY_DN6673_c0_g1_i4.p1  ORF type:complete len:358 (-),score=106.19 TRINITY_DN6673_c0_g1_i4:183-1256(-)
MKYHSSCLPLSGELLHIVEEYRELQKISNGLQIEHEMLKTRGDGQFAKCATKTIGNLGSANLLSVKISPHADLPLLAVGSSDKCLRIVNFSSCVTERVFTTDGAVIGLDWHPKFKNIIASCGMDGSLNVFDVSASSLPIIEMRNHSKFAVSVKWSESGMFIATASHDKSICLYSVKEEDSKMSLTLLKRFEYLHNVESLCFLHDTQLIASMSEDNNIRFIDTTTFEEEMLNVNSAGDDHISFSVLDVCLNPSGEFLLCSTDRDRAILFEISSKKQVRNYYGVESDIYSHPQTCWDASGQYIYSTSQNGTIVVWETSSQKKVASLQGHKKIPRSVDFSSVHNILASASFDRSVIIWSK